MSTSSADLLVQAQKAMQLAIQKADDVANCNVVPTKDTSPIQVLDAAIDETLCAVVDMVIARHGIVRRNPAFNELELGHLNVDVTHILSAAHERMLLALAMERLS
jgi:hypothetical protein